MAALRLLHADGVLVEADSPSGPGGVLVLEASDRNEAARVTDAVPPKRAGLIDVEIIALSPIPLP